MRPMRNGMPDSSEKPMAAETAEHFAGVGDRTAEDDAVGTRKIDVLEDTVLVRLRRAEADGFDAGAGDADHFAGFDFADVGGVEKIESTGFGGDDPGILAFRGRE